MNGDTNAVDRILDRTEGRLTLKQDSTQPRELDIRVTFDRKPNRLSDVEPIEIEHD